METITMTMHDKSFLKKFSVLLTIMYVAIQIGLKLVDFGGSKEHWDESYSLSSKHEVQIPAIAKYADSSNKANDAEHTSSRHFFTVLFSRVDTLRQGYKK